MTLASLTIRADAGPHVGLGHVMRCLAVAEAAVDSGVAVTMVSPTLPEGVHARLADAGIAWKPADGDLPPADAVLIDGYGFSRTEADRWRRSAPILAVMDDNAEMAAWPADIVINPNPHARPALYPGWAGPRFLLGSAYAPLRREFREADPIAIRENANRILITMGGSDPKGLTARILAGLPGTGTPVEITAVLGGMAQAPELGAASHHHLVIERDVRDMSRLMANSDIAISAAGSTLWELARLGVPTIAVVVADNQRQAAAAAAEKGLLHLVSAEGAASEAISLLGDIGARRALSDQARGQIDGHGAARILEALQDACA